MKPALEAISYLNFLILYHNQWKNKSVTWEEQAIDSPAGLICQVKLCVTDFFDKYFLTVIFKICSTVLVILFLSNQLPRATCATDCMIPKVKTRCFKYFTHMTSNLYSTANIHSSLTFTVDLCTLYREAKIHGTCNLYSTAKIHRTLTFTV